MGLVDVARDGTTASLVDGTLYVLLPPGSDDLGYRERALDHAPHAVALSPSGDCVALLGEDERIELASTRDLPRP